MHSHYLLRMHPRILNIVIRDRRFWEAYKFRLEREKTNWNALCFCTRGSGTLKLNDTEQRVQAGDMFTTRPRSQMCITTSQEEQLEFVSIHFMFHLRSEEERFESDKAGLPIDTVLRLPHEATLAEKFAHMLAMWRSKAPNYDWQCHLQFMQLLDLIRQWTSEGNQEELPIVKQAIRYMGACYGDPKLNRKRIAEHVAVVPGYLSVLFRKQTGLTLGEYLTKMRMDEAKTLLMTSSRTIHDIAGAVGFADSFYFSRVFKKQTGLTPSDFRKC